MDDLSNFPASFDDKRPPSKSQLQLQGPRPPPLSIHKDSHKIKKPPKPPLDHRHHHHHQHHNHQPPPQPVIIYAVSPKVIHATVDDFMTTVQRLTGVSSDNFCSGGDVSPAARLASIERVSPKAKGTTTTTTSIDIVEEGTEISRIPGVLSPATLPPVIQEMYFTPATEPSQFNYNFHGSSGFLASPSGLFSGVVGSPIFSPDFFSQIWNF